MNIFHALVLGIVEGVTEFIPISSTAHLIIVARLMNLTQTDFLKSFEIIIQFAAILAVVVVFWRRILTNLKLFLLLIVAFIPTAIIGVVLYPLVKGYLLDNITVIAWALIIGGIIIAIFEKFHKDDQVPMGYGNAFWTGLAQTLAFIPGVSRSGATIVGGMATGISRSDIVEFSFMLAIPTMVAASGYDLYKNLSVISLHGNLTLLIVGCVTAFISALIAIRGFLKYMQQRPLTVFAWYRIVVGILVLLFLK